jgi:diguanylate cyclase (GGDEF)-like protein/PAS domain S-box-containing protein
MEINLISIIVAICGFLVMLISLYAWQKGLISGARQFSVFMLFLSIYVVGYSMELSCVNLSCMVFWSKIQYIGIMFFPTTFLIFVIFYNQNDKWMNIRKMLLLFFIPLVVIFIKIGDESLHLIYASTSVDNSGLIPMLRFEKGPLYYFIVVYNLMAISIGMILILHKRQNASTIYREQTNVILIAALVIYIIYFLYLIGVPVIPSLPNLDLNPFSYMLWGIAIGVSILRYRLFNLAPIARDVLLEMLSDGVVVLDSHLRIVDANPEAFHIFGWKKLPTGEFANELLNDWIDPTYINNIGISSRIKKEVFKNQSNRHYELTISPLGDRFNHKIGYLLLIHDITERKMVENQLQELSLVDELTGLNNRRGFQVLASQLINMVNRMELNAVMFYLDMDNLKLINDTLGHAAGDQALKDVASILRKTFRASDIIARFGGDEFVVLAIESVGNSRDTITERLRNTLKEYNTKNIHGYELSFSVGTALYKSDDPLEMDVLLEMADSSMYEEKLAKRAGGKS